MVRTKAWDGITGMVEAIRGRWSSSQRWLREVVVWAGIEPTPVCARGRLFADPESRTHHIDDPQWQDTDIHSFFLPTPCDPLPLDGLAPMDRYPGLDYSTCVVEAGGAACARRADGVEPRGVYTVGDPRSLIVVGALHGAPGEPVRCVHVAHWQDDTPFAQIDAFFASLCAEREPFSRMELCIVEGCDGSFRTPVVIDHAWRLGIYPSYHASVAPVFGIAADPHGHVYRGDSPSLKAFLETRYAGGAFHLGRLLHDRND